MNDAWSSVECTGMTEKNTAPSFALLGVTAARVLALQVVLSKETATPTRNQQLLWGSVRMRPACDYREGGTCFWGLRVVLVFTAPGESFAPKMRAALVTMASSGADRGSCASVTGALTAIA